MASHGGQVVLGGGAAAQRARTPERRPFPLAVLLLGCGLLAVVLVADLLGLPARLLGHPRTAPTAVTASTLNSIGTMREVDANIRYIADRTGTGDGAYNDMLTNVAGSTGHVPSIVAAMRASSKNAAGIDAAVGPLGATTSQLDDQLRAMLVTSKATGRTMGGLETSIAQIGLAMGTMRGGTGKLAAELAKIDRAAGGVAATSGRARALTGKVDHALPTGIPKPQTSLNPPTTGAAQ